MADDDKAIDVVAAEGGYPPAGNKLVYILMILSILVMVLTPIITIYTFRAMNKDSSQPSENKEEPIVVTMVGITFNIADSAGRRYVSTDITIEVIKDGDKKFETNFAKAEDGAGPSRFKRIEARSLEILGTKSLDYLTSTEQRRNLAIELKKAFNEILTKDNVELKDKEIVTDVYFSKFLIQ